MPVEHAQIDMIPFPDSTDIKKQAIEVPGTQRRGQTGIQLPIPIPTPTYTIIERFSRTLSKQQVYYSLPSRKL